MSTVSEKEMIRRMWNGRNTAPLTDTPRIVKTQGGLKISCHTAGASVGYRVLKKGHPDKHEMHTVQTWDYGYVFSVAKNGTQRPAAPIWQVYNGGTIPISRGDTLKVNAMRIGYKPAETTYIEK
jgi:hypothetical protein